MSRSRPAKSNADRPVDHVERRADRAHDGLDQRGLAAARLAREAVDLVAVDMQADAVDRAHLAADAEISRLIVGAQVRHAEHALAAAGASGRAHRAASHAGEPAARIDVFVHRDGQEKQPDEQDHDEQHGEEDPPPDAGDQRGVLVRPVDHHADGRRIDVGEAEHRQRHFEADRPVHVVHRGVEHDRQHVRQVLLQHDLVGAHAGEHALLGELARLQAERDRADQPRVIGPAEARHRERQQRPRHLVAHHEVEQHQQRKQRDDDEGVVDRHQHAIDEAALVARPHPDRRSRSGGSGSRPRSRTAWCCGSRR